MFSSATNRKVLVVHAVAKARGRNFGAGLMLALAFALSDVQGFAVQRSVTLTQVVNQADAGLRWVAPAAIPYGEVLDTTQLSATAGVPGTFVYTPAAGAILPPGTQMLGVIFTPLDPGYRMSSLTVALSVTPPGSSSFQLQMSGAQPSSFVVPPNHDINIPLSIAPIGDFHQPVSFACSPSSALTCTFTPAVVRPTTAAVQVILTLHRVQLASNRPFSPGSVTSDRAGLNGEESAAPPFLACAFLLVGFAVRRRLSSRLRRLTLTAAIAALLPVCCANLGCGSGYAPTNLTITASSLVESRTLSISVSLPAE